MWEKWRKNVNPFSNRYFHFVWVFFPSVFSPFIPVCYISHVSYLTLESLEYLSRCRFFFILHSYFFLLCEIFLFPFVVQFTPAINSFRINKCLILKRTNQFILLIVRLSRLFPPSPLDRFHLISFSLIPSKDLPVFYPIWPLNEKTHKRHSQKFSSKNKTHFHSMVSKFNELLLYETLNSRWHSMRYN